MLFRSKKLINFRVHNEHKATKENTKNYWTGLSEAGNSKTDEQLYCDKRPNLILSRSLGSANLKMNRYFPANLLQLNWHFLLP